jgi:hypothetical protein
MKIIQTTFLFIVITMLAMFSLHAQGITIGNGTIFLLGSATLTLPNNWSNSGALNASSGTVIFNGASGDQTIINSAGETFNNIIVNKSIGNVQLINNISVNGTLTLASGDVELNGHTITLGTSAMLSETASNTVKGTSGTISTTRTLGANPGNVAGLGLNISLSPALGNTTIARVHTAYTNGNHGSITRSFNVTPAVNSSLNATVAFHFDDSELNGLTKSQLLICSSTDGGTSWGQVGGTVDVANNTVTVSVMNTFTLMTLSTNLAQAPVAVATTEFYTFPPTVKGDESSLILTVKDNSASQLTISSIILGTPYFSFSQTTPITVNGNDSIHIPVQYIPSVFGTVIDTLRITSDGGNIKVILNGSSPYPEIVMSTSILEFGEVENNTSKQMPVKVANNSINQLSVDSIYTETSYFSVDKTSGSVDTDTITLNVSFKPITAGSFSDTLYLRNNSQTELAKVPLNGSSTTTGVAQIEKGIPTAYSLKQNYPNPFNPSTSISFGLPTTSFVSLKLFDLIGREVVTIVSEEMPAGNYTKQWNARNCPSGVYFYRLQAGTFTKTNKLLLLK